MNGMSVGRNEPCPCGSGRKYKHCHAAARPSAVVSSPTAPLFSQAQQLLQEGNLVAAIESYREILKINPVHADALHYLGMAMCFVGDRSGGLANIRASLKLRPQDAIYHNNLALWLEETGDLEAAEQHFVRALGLTPEYREARLHLTRLLLRRRRYQAVRMTLENFMLANPADIEAGQALADALSHLGEYTAAQTLYRNLLRHQPENPPLRLALASLLQSSGQDEAAVIECDAVLMSDPADLAALQLRAFIAERCNRLDEAEQWVQKALAGSPEHGPSLRLKARLKRRRGDAQAALAILETVNVSTLPLTEQAYYHKECGAVLDKLSRYVEAFEAFRKGNEAAKRHIENQTGLPFYDAKKVRRDFENLKHFFSRERIASLGRFAPTPLRPAPLFIVGFPRSGTTLLEQMLSAHPNIHAGGELEALSLLETSVASRLADTRPYPSCLEGVRAPGREQALNPLRDAYLCLAREAGAVGDMPWFTDKMPLNETRLGLVRLLFPDSPVIHVIRHPLDVVLSCYMNELTHGNHCALDLESVAFHYAQVMELTEQHVAELGLRYIRLRYEDLVHDPETELRRLLDFIGEPWEARCLDFHRSPRLARTASYAQVAEPLYSTAQGRWRAYREQLEPIVPQLNPLISRLGFLD